MCVSYDCVHFVCLAEEYKSLVEKREIIRNEFHDKMVDASKVCFIMQCG